MLKGCALVLLLFLAGWTFVGEGAEGTDRTAVAVAALKRMKGVDLETNPRLKTAVLRVLEATRGTRDFVDLVKQFQVKGQEAGLLEVAVAQPADETGVEAARLLLGSEGGDLMRETLRGNNVTNAVALAEALGHTRDKAAVAYLAPVMAQSDLDVQVRKEAVRGLGRTREGSEVILQAAEKGELSDDLRLTAGLELSQVRWEEIKERAAQWVPPPASRNSQPLPPIAELARRRGDPNNGAKVFQMETTGCANCHQVHGQGRNVGPDLSEIGTKLAREAIYEAILDPSAGISFGFEAWQFELDDGEEAYGLLVSDSENEIAVKDTLGVVTRYAKSSIKSRRQGKLSIMPTGLQQTMTEDELVDLVEYLASLKKKTGS